MEGEQRATETRIPSGTVGYVASLTGAVGGAFGGTAAGVAAGFGYSGIFLPDAGLEELVPVGVGLVTEAALGAGLGSWLGVALVRGSGPALTGALTAVIAASIPAVLYRFVDTLESPRWLLPAIWLFMVAAAGLLANDVTSRWARAGPRTRRIGPAFLWLVAVVEMLVIAQLLVFP